MPDNAAPLILLTRPRAQAEGFAARCRERLRPVPEILIAPVMEIVPGVDLPDMGGVDGVIFTSVNGVRAFAAACPWRDLRCWCVGDRTAREAVAQGFEARSAAGTVDDLLALILSEAPDGVVVHVHGAHVTGDLVARLVAGGVQAQGIAAYDQRAVAFTGAVLARLDGQQRVLVPLFSPRSAVLVAKGLAGRVGPGWRFPCLSAAAKNALPPGLQAQASVCHAPTGEAMLTALARQLGHW